MTELPKSFEFKLKFSISNAGVFDSSYLLTYNALKLEIA
jgi:hypothetical protein